MRCGDLYRRVLRKDFYGNPSKETNMTKLLYIAIAHFDAIGVRRKLLAQITSLNDLGVNAKMLALTFDSDVPDYVLRNEITLIRADGLKPRVVKKRILRECREQILSFNPDIIYLRWPGSGRTFFSVLRGCGKRTIITEHQSIETVELHSVKGYRSLVTESLFGRLARRKIQAFVGVTKEICDYEVDRSCDPGKPCLVNGNGIDVASVPLRTPADFNRKNLDLLCVAQVAKWHGLDRLIRGMAEYKGSVNVRLHIVGDGSEVPNLKKLVSDLKLESSVIFHGFKTGEELDEFFDESHIAVGSLGGHRKSVSETSELKAREYCARGTPYICSLPDADFPADFPYILRVPSNEDPIDIEQVVSFAERVCSEKDHPQLMREYAINNLDWSIKMKKLIDFMNERSTLRR